MTHEESVEFLKKNNMAEKISNISQARLKDLKEQRPNYKINNDEDFIMGYSMGFADMMKIFLQEYR